MKATTTNSEGDVAAVLFGKFASDPISREIMSHVAEWPTSKSALTDRLGNFAKVVKWKARRGKNRRQIIEARVHPAVDWLLEIIVTALCNRDAKTIRLFADAIDAKNGAEFPAKGLLFTTWQTACDLSGNAMPFLPTGEPADVDTGEPALTRAESERPESESPGRRAMRLMMAEPAKNIVVPVTESELRREVERRRSWGKGTLNPGQFTRMLSKLNITCRKDSHSGGRGRKVLSNRNSKQKPT